MSTSTSEEKIAYLLTVLKHTALAKPDYAAIAVETGINTSNNAQRRFRSIIKGANFDLVNDQIVGPDGSTGEGGTPPTTPAKKGRGKKANGEPPKKRAPKKTDDETPSKKRKLSPPIVESASDEDNKTVKEEGAEGANANENEENGESDE